MDKELKAKWLEALKGGQYQHTKHRLRDPWKEPGKVYWCALGVLKDILGHDWDDCGDQDCSRLSDQLDLATQTNIAELNDRYDSYDVAIRYIEENL